MALLRFSDRVGKGLRSSPRDALLAAAVTPDQRGLAFGLHRAMDNAGAVIGPLAAAALLALQLPLRQIITWSLLPGIDGAARLNDLRMAVRAKFTAGGLCALASALCLSRLPWNVPPSGQRA